MNIYKETLKTSGPDLAGSYRAITRFTKTPGNIDLRVTLKFDHSPTAGEITVAAHIMALRLDKREVKEEGALVPVYRTQLQRRITIDG